MVPSPPPEDEWISSKEILERTGISRATLNNYIKLGILPRPLVRRPTEGMAGTKKIGYFPSSVLGRIQEVQRLKTNGESMEEIVDRFRGETSRKEKELAASDDADVDRATQPSVTASAELRLTLEEVSFPAYLLNYNFDLVWINRDAEVRLFKGILRHTDGPGSQNIFRWLFHWEFHSHVANWKNLVALHMAHAKVVKAGKTWISRLYHGISEGEVNFLEDTYDQVQALPNETVRDSYVSLLRKEGLSESFKVISLFSKQGILFIYVPRDRSPLRQGV